MSDLWVDVFKMTFVNALNSLTSVRKKYLCFNHSKFVKNELSKAMMQRAKLRNKFRKQQKRNNRN